MYVRNSICMTSSSELYFSEKLYNMIYSTIILQFLLKLTGQYSKETVTKFHQIKLKVLQYCNLYMFLIKKHVLRLLLYLTVLSHIPSFIQSTTLISYVDDTKILQAFKNSDGILTHQTFLNMTYKWPDENNIQFNSGKFQVLHIGQQTDYDQNTHSQR